MPMTEFREQDLTGARFERVSLRGATFTRVSLNDASMRAVDLTGVRVRGALFNGSRMRGVELVDVEISGELQNVVVNGVDIAPLVEVDVEISGELQNVVVNGVDIAPLVEAELNRRMPERARMRPDDSDGFREAWTILERLWEGTVARARALPEAALHRGVDGEWSFIQTLRHLNFASAAWLGRMILGNVSPWHPLDLPWDEAPGWDGIRWDREARPSLDGVLTVRRERQAMVRRVMESLTDEQLASEVTRAEPGWPRMESFPVKECLRIVLNEEWEHRLYAERDLTVLEQGN
jgi:DinB superfamily/Pentapeptide repeats (8 copies)